MMSEMGWREAILAVLQGGKEAVHYTDIADEIISRGLRTSVGATPANTVNVYISDSLNQQGAASPFERTARGYYRLRISDPQSTAIANLPTQMGESMAGAESTADVIAGATQDTTGLINALGMYWSRDKINWSLGTPKLLGRQTAGSQAVDFSDQQGVYLLYDRSEVIYVGRAIEQGIGTRLKQHTYDRLNGRWDRFSWFGVYSVSGNGELEMGDPVYDRKLLIATMEALLIESVEPSQNRRRGDEFRAVEFLQAEDPEIELIRMRALLGQMQSKLGI
jgi:HB1/ASXL restriction endonuclease-like protein with HTH domain